MDGYKAYAEKGSDDEKDDDDNSGHGKGSRDDSDDDGKDDDSRDDDSTDDDDRNRRINRLLAAPQDSAVTTTITIPLDAESHSAANPYSPNPATVSSGLTVTWTNADREDLHSATADDGSFTTGILSPGQSGKAVINAEPGTAIPYHCDIHPEMIGVLRVSGMAGDNAQSSTTLQSTVLTNPSLKVSDQPLALGQYTTGSEDIAGNANQISVAGSTTITIPNSNETIATNGTGVFMLSVTESAGVILEGQIHLTTQDGLEEATITLIEFFRDENAPGFGIASFSTNSTGKLAPLDSIVAVTLHSDQPGGSAQLMFFEWHTGPLIDNNQAQGMSDDGAGGSQVPVPPSAENQSVGSTIVVSIPQGAMSRGGNAFIPSPVQVKIGDTVTWTNDDTIPHTVTSGTSGMPDGSFDSPPNLNPLIGPGKTFEHMFEEAGEFPYYCALHPNMVGTVSVS